MFLYGLLLVCAFLAALLVVRYDMYDREPWWMLVLTAVAGAVVMWGLSHVEDWSIAAISDTREVWALAAVAATHEEGARLLIVIAVAYLAPRHFNDPMDGLVYGSIAGVGMAAYESWLYVDHIPEGEWIYGAPELVRIFGHLSLGGITGFAVGMRRMKMRRWKASLATCFTLATGMHYLVDWNGLNDMLSPSPSNWYTVGVSLTMLAGLLTYGVLTRLGGEWSRQVFRPDALPNLLVLPWTAWTSPLPDVPPEVPRD
ncbi:MAG: PrsW family glutamic-type intramembrane protease [Planctomycetota bacterium]